MCWLDVCFWFRVYSLHPPKHYIEIESINTVCSRPDTPLVRIMVIIVLIFLSRANINYWFWIRQQRSLRVSKPSPRVVHSGLSESMLKWMCVNGLKVIKLAIVSHPFLCFLQGIFRWSVRKNTWLICHWRIYTKYKLFNCFRIKIKQSKYRRRQMVAQTNYI